MQTRYLTIILYVAILAGCGFHLRGSGPTTLNLSSVYVDASSARKLGDEVTSQLSGLGVTTPATADEAEVVLKLRNERQERNLLSVSGDTGKVEEYEIVHSALMSVVGTDGNVISKEQLISARRDLAYDEDAVLGKFEEERTVQVELRKQVASNILRRLNAVVK